MASDILRRVIEQTRVSSQAGNCYTAVGEECIGRREIATRKRHCRQKLRNTEMVVKKEVKKRE
jgi:hypothetical protein